eukprot:UN02727
MRTSLMINPYYFNGTHITMSKYTQKHPLVIDLVQYNETLRVQYDDAPFLKQTRILNSQQQYNNNNNNETTTQQQQQPDHHHEVTTQLKKRITYNRNITTDATIVRIMKQHYAMNKQQDDIPIKYQDLYERCVKHCAKSFDFELDQALFKARFQAMLDNEYIIRDDDDHTLLYYNP